MKHGTERRRFLKSVALAGGAATGSGAQAPAVPVPAEAAPAAAAVEYPRKFSGRRLAMLAFPLGGIGAGSISLGGRGQLRDWEMFNRPDKGRSPEHAFAAIWVRSGSAAPVARVLEARMAPPYEAARGLGPDNVPGLRRLASATFTGEFPKARIDFRDAQLPVKVSLEAFSPFVPMEVDDSGLPAAVLRYRVANPGSQAAAVSIAFSVENPVGMERRNVTRRQTGERRRNEYRAGAGLEGLFMSSPGLDPHHPLAGSFALAALNPGTGKMTHLTGWPAAKWWASPLLYWDDFSSDGELGPEAGDRNVVGAICLKREIAAGEEGEYTFLLAWHFPNRTPAWCGWEAPVGEEQTIIGNHYCTRFPDAWRAAEYAAGKLAGLEKRMDAFLAAMRESTLPAAVKEGAMAKLSTLVTQTVFRTADGEFHGFEGCDDQRGCCFGNCTHVWNYETATQHLFPAMARSLRKSAFGYAQDEQGAMRHRQLLPDGKRRYGYAAADGQMGQIIKAYLDWRLSGDMEWLREYWPKVKRGIEFCWVEGGWDADRDGVMEGVQHNTYDVEFYGPNPMTGIYYLGGLRAAEEMARAAGDSGAAAECRRLFESGAKWIDEHLFNGSYYIQKIRGIPREKIAPTTVSDMGSDRPDTPEFQLGEGCLVDQLVGQYLADVAGLGPLVNPANTQKTLQSIYRYNYKRQLYGHDSVQRVFALNDESALVICDYGSGRRPAIPFPYFAEVMTGFEYQAAAHMMFAGMVREGVECFTNIRRRYDGERRNPWDEAECGHHYARAMASWSAVLALSGFQYHGAERRVTVQPRINASKFKSFWSTATGWGTFGHVGGKGGLQFSLSVIEGQLPFRAVRLAQPPSAQTSASLEGRPLSHRVERRERHTEVILASDVVLKAGDRLAVTL